MMGPGDGDLWFRTAIELARPVRVSYTTPYSLTGRPCAVVRCGTSTEGLPIDVQLVTRPRRDDLALALAGALESALGVYRPPSL
jgi:amidase